MLLALLDDAGVLTGFAAPEDDAGLRAAATVEVPDDCDLAPGRYRWDADIEAFMPVGLPASAGFEIPPGGVPAVTAIAAGFIALRDQGVAKLPAETLAWLRQFERKGRG